MAQLENIGDGFFCDVLPEKEHPVIVTVLLPYNW
jgi:hypothetical protein